VAAPLGERVAMIPDASGSEADAGAAESNGSVLVHVSWAETGEPASGILVGASYRDDPSYLEWQEARSGADGSALLDGLHAGPLHLLSDRGAWADVDVRAGERTEKELAILRGIDVSGRVIDTAEKGVAGASITLSRGYTSHGSIVAEADEEGRFELRDVMVGQSLGARAPGREPTRIEEIAGVAGSKVDIVLRFEGDGGVVEGFVLDATGGPIAGALVCVGDEHGWQSAGGKSTAAGLRVRSGEDGRFRVEGVPVGTIPITARARGFAPARTTLSLRPGATEDLELRLGRGATLEGLVLGEEGAAVDGARISVGTEPYARPGDLGYLRTESGSGGRYALVCVPAGEVEVRVETKQDGKASERGLLAEGEHRKLDFHLSPGNVIAGRLVDPQGHPLAHWLVDGNCTARRFLNFEEAQGAVSFRGYTRSGDDGSFLIPNCPALEVTLSAFPPDGISGQPAAMLKVEKPPATDLRFVVPASLAPTAWIRGRLRMSDGSPIPSMELYAFDSDRKSPRATMAEIDRESGEFRVGPLGPGSWGIEVHSDRVCRLDAAPVELVRDQDRDLGTIDLVAAGFVRARVVHREEGDWKKVRIGLCDPDIDRRDGHNDKVLQFDLTGTTWKSPPLAPGTQEVVIKIGDGAEERRKLVIRSGEETPLEIEVD
jgi:hypothetical protein